MASKTASSLTGLNDALAVTRQIVKQNIILRNIFMPKKYQQVGGERRTIFEVHAIFTEKTTHVSHRKFSFFIQKLYQ
jgi:hypothetical protein